jgi:hypothetical protein
MTADVSSYEGDAFLREGATKIDGLGQIETDAEPVGPDDAGFRSLASRTDDDPG